MRLTRVAVVCAFLVLGLPGITLAQVTVATPWAGWVQCLLTVQAPLYNHRETQTWRLNGTPTILSGGQTVPALWTVVGEGWFQKSGPSFYETAQWSVNGQGAATIGFTFHADRITIQKTNAQLVARAAVTGSDIVTVNGVRMPQGTLPRDTGEYSFPKIEPVPTVTRVTATGPAVPIGSIYGPLAPGNATGTATCSWDLARGSDVSALTQPPAVAPTPQRRPPAPPANITVVR
jgi:hypothetical protein